MKTCKHCLKRKPLADFYVDKNNRSGRKGVCKKCICKQVKLRGKLPRDQRRHALKHLYKLTPEQFTVMVEVQDGRCMICLEIVEGNLDVDHDGAVRADPR